LRLFGTVRAKKWSYEKKWQRHASARACHFLTASTTFTPWRSEAQLMRGDLIDNQTNVRLCLAMLTLVKRLWVEGRRRRPRDISADAGTLGELRQHRARAANGSEYSVLKLTSNGAKCLDIIPPLYESTLLIVDSEHFKLRGFERLGLGDDAFTVLQEWYCTTVCPACVVGQHAHAVRE
jgi:hypothetical protein